MWPLKSDVILWNNTSIHGKFYQFTTWIKMLAKKRSKFADIKVTFSDLWGHMLFYEKRCIVIMWVLTENLIKIGTLMKVLDRYKLILCMDKWKEVECIFLWIVDELMFLMKALIYLRLYGWQKYYGCTFVIKFIVFLILDKIKPLKCYKI